MEAAHRRQPMRSVTQLGLIAAALIFSVAAYAQTPSPSTPADQNASGQTPSIPAADKPAASDQTTPPSDTTQVPPGVPAEKPIPGHPTATPKESKDAAKKVKEQNKTD